MTGWNVWLNGKLIDKVFYVDGFSSEEVKESLVDHDAYNPNIKVRKEKKYDYFIEYQGRYCCCEDYPCCGH